MNKISYPLDILQHTSWSGIFRHFFWYGCWATFKNVNKKARRRNKKIQPNAKQLKILYSNANGITGKITSLTTAMKEQETSIALIAETKLESEPPKIDEYKWMPRNRNVRKGGGVAIIYHESLTNNIKPLENIEKENMEIQWAEIKSGTQKTFIGIYYGNQEKAPAEEVQSDFDAIKSQINTLKQEGDVILVGDFNAKLKINIPSKNINQAQSRNGEMLQSVLEEAESIALNTKENICEWTRENRKKPDEKSIIDYVIVSRKTEAKIKDTKVDIAGTHRLKGKEETDHNTILLETNMSLKTNHTLRKVWKKGKPQDWANFNNDIEKTIKEDKPKNFDELEELITKKLKKHIGQITIKNNRKRESKKAKEIREKKKEAAKQYKEACETKPNNIEEIKNHYIDMQKKLREQLENDEIENRKNTANRLIKKGASIPTYSGK